jgi:dihydrofolate reductase
MADDAAERVRREFVGKAPELRRTLVAELSGLLDKCSALAPDELTVLHHVLAYAGYSLDGGLYIPAFAALWGGEESYFPAVHLPAERARAAAVILRRRGVLRDLKWTPRAENASHTEGIFLEADVLRELAAKPTSASASAPTPSAPAVAAPEPATTLRRVILYIAASVDGFIAKRGGDIGFLSQVESPGEDYGYVELTRSVDTVIMGRKTYDKAKKFSVFPHESRRTIVLSRKKKGKAAGVEFRSGDFSKLIAKLRKEPGGDIFVDGGAETVHALLKKDLIDVLVVSTVPVLLGGGIPLFKPGRPELRLKLVFSRSYPTGLVQSRYERV